MEMEQLRRENEVLRNELQVHQAMLNKAQDTRELIHKVFNPSLNCIPQAALIRSCCLNDRQSQHTRPTMRRSTYMRLWLMCSPVLRLLMPAKQQPRHLPWRRRRRQRPMSCSSSGRWSTSQSSSGSGSLIFVQSNQSSRVRLSGGGWQRASAPEQRTELGRTQSAPSVPLR